MANRRRCSNHLDVLHHGAEKLIRRRNSSKVTLLLGFYILVALPYDEFK